ncbi:MAG: enoyl-CoA hydratase-related protein [Pseudomonadales bacterium]|jgi:enoyl-CoA hydratase/carnithine racemase|nr:enoyl-CoA hydratase-related protein [Pseudomonadales bacterium]MDG1442674.1 enoyl-CoA hydratase-related protein [Pseudomonadales bacterium]
MPQANSIIELDTGTDELLCRIESRVAVITLNKPQKKNALGDILTPALRRTLLMVEDDDRVGCVMITGAGNAFCAGGDVSEMGPGPSNSNPSPEAMPKHREERIADLTMKQSTLTQRLFELDKVTIAALPGAAAGAGVSIALACDLRVASTNAFITTAFRNIGLSGDYGGSWFLPRLIGLAKAKELYYTSPRVDASTCLTLGIFNQVFEADEFQSAAFEYAKAIAQGPTRALGRMKKNLNASLQNSLSESLEMESRHLIASAGTQESKEAVTAFMEKRQPKFHD